MRHADTNVVNFLNFILIVQLKNTSALFVISNWTSSWTNASQDGCVLATPNISYHGNNYQVDSTDIPEDIHEPVWIGYYKMPTAFEYVGCIETKALRNGRKLTTNVSKPSDCLPGCENDSYIGVAFDTETDKHDCHCLADYDDSTSNVGCTNECPGMNEVACGSTNRVSVYRIASGGIASNHTIENECLTIKQRKEKWIDCTRSLKHVMCEYENILTSASMSRNSSFKWLEAVENCLLPPLRPSSYNLSISFNGSNEQLWTGVFKSGVIYKHESWKRFTSGEQYGYIEKSNGTLKFDEDSSRKMLCKTVTPLTSTLSTEITEAFQTQSTQPSDKLNIKQGDGTSAKIIVPVVVPVAIVFLIFVIVLIIICIKRKHKLKLGSQKKVISNNKQYVASYSCSQARGADEHVLDENGPPDAMSPYYDDDQKTATYDTTTTHVRSKDVGQPMDNKEHEDVNVYNKLGDHEREETYDQTTVWKDTTNALISNSVYDTNESSVSEYEYAKAGTGLSSNVEKLPDHVYSTSQQREGVSNI